MSIWSFSWAPMCESPRTGTLGLPQWPQDRLAQGASVEKKDLDSIQGPVTCKRLACPTPPLALSPGTPSSASSPYSCSFHLPASSIPPLLVPRTSPWAFIFPLRCSRGKLDTFLHPLLPHPPALGPKASPSGSASHPSLSPHLQQFPGKRCGEQ